MDLAFGQGEEIVVDLQKGDGEPSFEGLDSRPQQALVRFGDLFGAGPGQIPVGAEIFGGFLTLNVLSESDSTATISLHRMLIDWTENTATWQDPQGAAGDLATGGLRPDGVAGRVQVPLNVETLQAWANGGVVNYGWLIVSDSPDSFRFESSESSLMGAFRPQLTVLYTQPSGAGTLEFALDEGTRVTEGGTASVVVNRVGGSAGSLQFTYAITPGTGSLADLGTATPGSPITFAAGETFKVIQILMVNDSAVEADETFSIAISVGGAVADTTTLTIRDDDFAVASNLLRLNEMFVNSPGADNPHEFIELVGTAGLGLGGFYVLVLDSDLGPQTGLDDFAVSLGAFRNGASGFTIVTAEDHATNQNRGDVPGDGAPVDNFGFWVPAATTRITDAALNGEVIANDSASFVLIYSPLADLPTMGFDFDWNNDGVLDLPAGAVIVDSIAINDGGAGDVLYGGTNFQAAFVADSISRLSGNTDRSSTDAWFGGDTKGSDDPLVYEDGRTLRLPVEGAALTPGEANVTAVSARVRLVSVAPGAGGQSLVLTFDGPISQVLDGDGSFTSATGYGIAVSTTTGVAVPNVEPQPNVTGLGTNTLTVTFRGNAVSGGLPPAGTYRLNFVGNSLIGNGRSTDNDLNAGTAAASNGSFNFEVVASGTGLIIVQDTVITVASGSQTDSTVHARMERLIKRGAGTLVLSGASTHGGGTIVEAGTVIVRNLAALGSGSLEVRAGARLVLDVGAAEVSVASIALANGALLDVGAGRLTAVTGLTRTSLLEAINSAKGDFGFCSLRCQADRVFQDAEEFPGPQGIEWQCRNIP
ncbi:MAG: DNRLRE domain-containing protein, partial [Planctomycetes bacterium]|nr:DNRLRE domain-containing protein [Planctomycetota bacterium]